MTTLQLYRQPQTQDAARVRFTLDVNNKFIGKVKRRDMYAFNMTFQTVTDWTLDMLAEHIGIGFAWCNPFAKVIPDGRRTYRNKCNVTGVQLLGLDADSGDDGATFAYWMTDQFFGRYGAMLHTTSSHTLDNPRCRAIFLLDEPMPVDEAERSLRALHWLYPHVDTSASDASRVFYGARGCAVQVLANVLPVAVMRQIVAQHDAVLDEARRQRQTTDDADHKKRTRSPSAPQPDDYVLAAVDSILQNVEHTTPGTGASHHTVRDAAVRLCSLARADWHAVNLDDWPERLLRAARKSGYFDKYYNSEKAFYKGIVYPLTGNAEAKQGTVKRQKEVAAAWLPGWLDSAELSRRHADFFAVGDDALVQLPNGRTVRGRVEAVRNSGDGWHYRIGRTWYPRTWLRQAVTA